MPAHEFFLRPPARLLEQTLPVAIPTRGQQRANSARRKLYSNGDSVRKMPCFSEFSRVVGAAGILDLKLERAPTLRASNT
jgi:hypothetical protein